MGIEPLEGRLLLAADYGDAPDTYGTSIAAGGAFHSAGPWFLGTKFDMENDAAPTAFADGDGADEDGVTFYPLRAGGEAIASVFVTNSSPSTPVRLDAWIDFDGDGTFSGANERIAASALMLPGSNLIKFNVPADAALGGTYARFRLSSTTALATPGPRGNGGQGEVEDYAVQILSPNASSAPFVEQLIVNGNRGSGSLYAVDMDRDGDLDLVSHDFLQSTVVWHANTGNGSFVQQKTEQFVSGQGLRVSAGDYDVDGRMDMLVAGPGEIYWIWQSPQGSYFRISVSSATNAAVAIDAMKDGRIDVLTAGEPSNIFRLHHNDVSSNTIQNIATGTTGATAIDAADIDGDGDIDFIGGTAADNTVAWYEYLGPSGGYARRVISTEVVGVRSAKLIDLDGDDDLDVLTYSSDGEIEWFENNGAQSFTRHLIATIAGVHDLNQADVDGDGDLDILVAAGAAGAKLLTNDGQQAFTESALPVNTSVPIRTIVAGDFDGDGILEIAVGGHDFPASSNGYLALLRRGAELDFGDAPASYGTTLATDGARHFPIGPTLGATRDSEIDGGSPTSKDGVDEDGVTLGLLQAGDFNATTVVNVQNAPAGARLDAWIDFDGDGTFSGANERIAANLAVVEGINTLSFAIPATAARYTYARFRLSSDGGLGPQGGAADGEVEDYEVSITPAVAGSGSFGEKKSINSESLDVLAAADLDQDGDVDLLTAPYGSSIYWYVNDGQGNFQRRNINGSWYGTPESIDVVDLNGDGRLDLLVKTATTLFAMYQLDSSAFFTSVLSSTTSPSLNPIVIDFDQDGDVDVVLPERYSGTNILQFYLNRGNGQFQTRTISLTAVGQPYYAPTAVAISDADGDGDLDVYVAADSSHNRISLYRNDGQENFSFAFNHNLQYSSSDRVRDMRPEDFDGDGDVDLVVTMRGLGGAPYQAARDFFLLDNQGDGTLVMQPVYNGPGEFRTVSVVDLDSDGDRDFIVTLVLGGRVLWYDNIGNGDFIVRLLASTATVYNNEIAQHAIADVDGDGKLDLIWATRYNGGLTWLKQLTEPLYDYGDAPFPYPLYAKDNGARHTATGPRLGSQRTEEALPEAGVSDGDDGVAFASFRVAQTGATAIVHVENAPAGAKLDAWIDFDGDGNWSRAEERIAVSVAVVEGENVITFDVPAWAKAGASYARFRISSGGGLGYAGVAPDGEVEDHPVTILPPVAAAGPYLEQHLISNAAFGPSLQATLPVDLDQDGDQDIVISLDGSRGVVWFENDGAGGFTQRDLSGGSGIAGGYLAAGDVDLDGDIDLLVHAISGQYMAWLINDGNLNFTHQAVRADASYGVGPLMSLIDIEGDGDIDYLGGNFFIRDLANPQPGIVRSISPTHYFAPSFVADVDRDGRLDLVQRQRVTVGPGANALAVAEYVLEQFNGTTTLAVLGDGVASTQELQRATAADLDRDGDLDLIIVGHRQGANRVLWLENDGRQNYTERMIDSNGASPWDSIHAVDLDGDGDLDLVASTTTETLWFENDGSQNFTKHVAINAGGITLIADMNGDGKLDVLLQDRNASRYGLSWFSLTDRQVSVTASPATVAEAGAESIVYKFTRSGNLTGALTVPFSVGGTAAFGVDYTVTGAASFDAASGTVTFADGVDAVEVIVTPLDDNVKELQETVSLTLQPVAGHALGSRTATATILTEELAGDYVDDGRVDGFDFLAWQLSFGQPADPIGGGADGNLDGQVDGEDLKVWKANYGQTTTPEVLAPVVAVSDAAVPSLLVAALTTEDAPTAVEEPAVSVVETFAAVWAVDSLAPRAWYEQSAASRGSIILTPPASLSASHSPRPSVQNALQRRAAADAAFAGELGWSSWRPTSQATGWRALAARFHAAEAIDDAAAGESDFDELARQLAEEFSTVE